MKKLKILIVEDDKHSQMLLSIIVKKYADNILVTDNGLDAISIVKSNPDIDLVFMDIRIHGIDGYETIRRMREFNTDVAIFALSANDYTDTDKILQMGANEFVQKPIKIDKLKHLIETYFKLY